MFCSVTFILELISILHIDSLKVFYDIRYDSSCHNFVVNKFVYAGLEHLHLVARETNFSPYFTPELAISRRHAYQLNPLVRCNSDLVWD